MYMLKKEGKTTWIEMDLTFFFDIYIYNAHNRLILVLLSVLTKKKYFEF